MQLPVARFLPLYIPAAFAKLLVWSFIEGFSERFVPNILNNLGRKVEEKVFSRIRFVIAHALHNKVGNANLIQLICHVC